MVYNIDFDIASIFISVFTIFCVIYKKNLPGTQTRTFMLMVVFSTAAGLFDLSSAVLNRNPESVSRVLLDFLHIGYLTTHNISSMVFFIYVLLVSETPYLKNKVVKALVFIPGTISLLLILFNPLNHWIYTYDADGFYIHSPLFIILYIIAVSYLVSAALTAFVYRKSIPRNKFFVLSLYFVLIIGAVLFQYFFPYLLIEIFIQSICQLGILFTIENVDEVFNGNTNLYNLHAFVKRTNQLVNNRSSFGLVFIKIGNLQFLNASLGITHMSDVSKQLAGTLKQLSRDNTPYDCENGRFVIIVRNHKEKDVADEIRQKLAKSWIINHLDISVPIQIFSASIPHDIDNMNKIMIVLDSPYTDDSTSTINKTLARYERTFDIEKAIAHALKNNKFEVFYQPIYSFELNRINSCEALIRLKDEKMGYISPEEFIPIAEKNGSILEIGLFVIDEVCHFIQNNNLDELGIEYVEINLSVVQCMQNNLANEIIKIIKSHNIDLKKINLEVTETAAATMSSTLMSNIKTFTKAGISLSLDDYGSGYSTISYLFNIPFSYIKIDKEVIWAMDDNPKATIAVKNTINMIKELGFHTIVEGIENENQLKRLKQLGADYIQGYYFSPPIEKDQFITYLKKQS